MGKPEPKFRKITLRLPIERSAELDQAAKELGLPPANFACMQLVQALNARRIAAGMETISPN